MIFRNSMFHWKQRLFKCSGMFFPQSRALSFVFWNYLIHGCGLRMKQSQIWEICWSLLYFQGHFYFFSGNELRLPYSSFLLLVTRTGADAQ